MNRKDNWINAMIAIATIAIVSCARDERPLPKYSSPQDSVMIHVVRSDEGYEAMGKSDFAIVFINTPWSATAMFARKGFSDFILSNALVESGIKFDSFVVADESDDLFTNWISQFDLDLIGPVHVAPMGAGSVLWLKRGKLVGFELNTSSFSKNDFIDRTEKALNQPVK